MPLVVLLGTALCALTGQLLLPVVARVTATPPTPAPAAVAPAPPPLADLTPVAVCPAAAASGLAPAPGRAGVTPAEGCSTLLALLLLPFVDVDEAASSVLVEFAFPELLASTFLLAAASVLTAAVAELTPEALPEAAPAAPPGALLLPLTVDVALESTSLVSLALLLLLLPAALGVPLPVFVLPLFVVAPLLQLLLLLHLPYLARF